ncbi:hypothetical protein MBEHAL_0193 [Halarchaeum acidiphilum MH1-52-1]|uniref:Uncharacterized protein n=2 Tax=Halarchaeum acidiphilum TaxID=489138 RepID=U3A9J7_9EURY|nr:hypothetical protein MBEHAL_0193 [Halarchaeum acidiphilum MH1-52-1]
MTDMRDTSESMTHAYNVRTAGTLRSVAVRAADGVRRGYDVSRRGFDAARRRVLATRLAIADARDAAA